MLNNNYNFNINNSIIQYHKSNKCFRIMLSDFRDMCLMVDTDDYFGTKYYVLKRIPQEFKDITINFIKCDNISSLNIGDLIYTPQLYHHDITEETIKDNANYAFILKKNNDSIDIVRVVGNNIEYIPKSTPTSIFKVTID